MSASTPDPHVPASSGPPGRTAAPPAPALRDALAAALTQQGDTLLALSERRPLLLVFLRHFG